jgi:hypothetical protein
MEGGVARRASIGRLMTGLAGVAALVFVFVLLFGRELASLASFRKVDDYPLYVMNLEGGYDLGDLLGEAMRQRAERLPVGGEDPGWACTVFAALGSDGGKLLGRNFDWRNRPTLLLFTEPDDGYASASMVDLSYLGFDAEDPAWYQRLRLFDAPFLPFDGMNEAGLAVGMMAVSHAEPGHDPERITLDSLQIIRLLLDRAGTVDEALALLRTHNVTFLEGPPLHYLITDAGGHSVVVEYLDGGLSVLRNEQSWQVATNFLLSGLDPVAAGAQCPRYREAWRTLEVAEGSISPPEAMGLLERVSQLNTMWSVVYEITSGGVSVAMGRDYDQVYEFQLRAGAD